jgi:hypothetical protein
MIDNGAGEFWAEPRSQETAQNAASQMTARMGIFNINVEFSVRRSGEQE